MFESLGRPIVNKIGSGTVNEDKELYDNMLDILHEAREYSEVAALW